MVARELTTLTELGVTGNVKGETKTWAKGLRVGHVKLEPQMHVPRGQAH